MILGVFVPVAAAAGVSAARRMAFAWGHLLAALLAGWVFWTIFEYALHRWVLHHTRRPWIRRVFWDALHKDHHGYKVMSDPDHHGVHIALTLPPVLLLAVVASASPSGWMLAILSGWLVGYLCYESLHWLFHASSPMPCLVRFGPIARLLQIHTIHHLHHANMNYGFVTQFWDRQLGTAVMPEDAASQHTVDAT